MSSRYRFALRPRWILSHLFVLALVAAMIWAGIWQLHRRQEKLDRNAKITARTEQTVVPVGDLVPADDAPAPSSLEYRRVTATGTYQADQEVLVRSRSLDGAPGSWVLTPLLLDDGRAVVVNRGWIPNSGQLEAVPDEYTAPDGPVEVGGVVRLTETRGSFGPTDPNTGTLTNLARADLARLDQQVPEDLLPIYLQLDEADPPITTASPRPVPLPALDEGPHLSYAVQWLIFTTVALVGYPLILRRRARELAVEADDEDDADDDTDGEGGRDDADTPTPIGAPSA